ncbi:MMPL family transporter [Tenuibacillus multivorans]|uniref:Putative drug exporter of the RND superfamily n=1 Tax=Tenuibacillus multivorans TaxID=237069 RepID=A0A1H0DXA4_9BACI|nr:MMPL family transporter [Tenuibacillus multivorans]GEL76742.1 membrane protein [Tenuibacillus multivorans]SDN74772.1 putative drug exporter of the RND superfamily [Tenuibacillus multivorans]
MRKLLQAITDRVSTKKGMWITLTSWLVITMLLAVFAPNAKDYEVSRIASLPDDAPSVIANEKVDEYFAEDDGTLALLVFQNQQGEINVDELAGVVDQIQNETIHGVKSMVPLSDLPPQAMSSFLSKDGTTAMVPMTYETSLETDEMSESNEQINGIVEASTDLSFYVTGPAGIATDSLDLFSQADLVLIFSTIGIILILLVIIYRSPLLAFIPLLAAAFVYEATMQILGLMGKAGLAMSNQTLSIMSILLFAAVIDYSLFVLSRFREELKVQENKYEAMKLAMGRTGMPVFFSGGTVLAAMLVLFFAQLGDYQNFAPSFATTMAVIMLASVTLVPALFTLFGRKSFWPKIPRVGDELVKNNSFWLKVGRLVSGKPVISVALVGIFLIASALNLFNLKYEFNTLNSFPEDMPSRAGYQILEEKFDPGDLAPTTVLLEGEEALNDEQVEDLREQLSQQPLVNNVRMNGVAEDGRVINYSLAFSENPYDTETIDELEAIIQNSDDVLANNQIEGELYFAGETATKVDDRNANNRDVVVIVTLETILIFIMLIVLTRSIKMPVYMMGTIIVSFLAALGLGKFLTNLFFDIDTISNRVPLYAFVFLVALGIDYNIMLVSRFQEERKKHGVKQAVELAVANTGGVITSAGLILAATFAVLMTQPVQLLFVFGFIVAIGILLDTFLIRGVLLPGLIVLFERKRSG